MNEHNSLILSCRVLNRLTCKILKGGVGLHVETLPVGIEGLVAHLTAVLNGLDSNHQNCRGNISPAGHLRGKHIQKVRHISDSQGKKMTTQLFI